MKMNINNNSYKTDRDNLICREQCFQQEIGKSCDA